MTRSFSHYTNGARVYLTTILKIFLDDVLYVPTPSGASPSHKGTTFQIVGRGLAPEEASDLNAE